MASKTKTGKPYFDKTGFTFPYKVVDIKAAIDKMFETKNDYSWTEHEKTTVGCLDLECSYYTPEDTIMLNAQESATLGLYKKGKTKKVAKTTQKKTTSKKK